MFNKNCNLCTPNPDLTVSFVTLTLKNLALKSNKWSNTNQPCLSDTHAMCTHLPHIPAAIEGICYHTLDGVSTIWRPDLFGHRGYGQDHDQRCRQGQSGVQGHG